jgi:hypothetical protein
MVTQLPLPVGEGDGDGDGDGAGVADDAGLGADAGGLLSPVSAATVPGCLAAPVPAGPGDVCAPGWAGVP